MTRGFRAVALAVIAGSSTWLGACSDSPTGPGTQPQIINQPGNFEYQVSDVQGYTGTISYTWQNNGTQANVNQASTLSSGSVTLRILDASGAQVYSRSLAENGTFATTAGQAGTWTVRVIYSAAVAPVVNFRAQTPYKLGLSLAGAEQALGLSFRDGKADDPSASLLWLVPCRGDSLNTPSQDPVGFLHQRPPTVSRSQSRP